MRQETWEMVCHSEERLFATKNLGWTTQDSSLEKALAQNDRFLFQDTLSKKLKHPLRIAITYCVVLIALVLLSCCQDKIKGGVTITA